MYIVEVKGNYMTCEKEFKRKSFAIKAAEKARSDGFIYFDNPMLSKVQRKVPAESIRVYNSEDPEDFGTY